MKKIILSISALIMFQLLGFSQIVEVDFRKFPYLIYHDNPGQMTVLWQPEDYDMNDNDVECTISWEDDFNNSGSATINDDDAEIDFQYIYTINGLQPLTKYYYTVIINNLTLQDTEEFSSSFVTAPSSGTNEVTFYAYGDTRNEPDSQNKVLSRLLDHIEGPEPHPQTILLHTGDWVGVDTEAAWDYEYFNVNYSGLVQIKSMIPVMGAIGNHDDGVNNGLIYRKYWPYYYFSSDVNDFWYSFDYGPVHFTIVDHRDDDDPVTAEQLEWIEDDLKSTNKKWKVMVFHAPAYSSGPHGNCPVAQQILHPLCVKHCVNLVFNGHNHNYAHWLIEGIHHLTLGGGGTDTYTPTTTSGEGFIFTEETHHFAEFDYTNDEVIVNIYKTTLDDHYSIENFTIKKNYTFCDNDDVTWEDWKTGLGTVRICDGSKLTIKSIVSFSDIGKIIVEKGGERGYLDRLLRRSVARHRSLGRNQFPQP